MRWKLMCPHYLNLAGGTEWEYVEVSGGKSRRHKYLVPRHLDPRDPGDWNSRWGQRSTGGVVGNEEGEVVVCHPGQGQPGDYEFVGDPSPDMMPLDDEAKALSESFADRWSYRPDGAEQSFSQSLIDAIDSLRERPVEAAPIKIEGLDQAIALMAQTQKMMADLVAAQSSRRV